MVSDEIKQAMKEAVAEALAEQTCALNCPLTSDAAESLGHFFGMLRDVGNGDVRAGIETIRSNMSFVGTMKQSRQKISEWIAKTAIVTIIAGVITLVTLGIKAALNK